MAMTARRDAEHDVLENSLNHMHDDIIRVPRCRSLRRVLMPRRTGRRIDGQTARVRKLLLFDLAPAASSEEVAAKLRISPRTLRRKLRKEQTSLRKLVYELRMRLALRYLDDMILTVEEIAHAVGFSGPAGLRRALRRWARRTPPDRWHP